MADQIQKLWDCMRSRANEAEYQARWLFNFHLLAEATVFGLLPMTQLIDLLNWPPFLWFCKLSVVWKLCQKQIWNLLAEETSDGVLGLAPVVARGYQLQSSNWTVRHPVTSHLSHISSSWLPKQKIIAIAILISLMIIYISLPTWQRYIAQQCTT